MPRTKLTKSAIDALPILLKDVVYWDANCPGFGVKVTPTGRKVFVVLYRTAGAGSRLRKYTIGTYGRVTLNQARVTAQKVFAAKLDGRDLGAERKDSRRSAPFQDFSLAKRELDQLSGVTGWRLHDLRRTCVSGMARLGVAPHVADKILNHQNGAISGVAAVYQRHDFLAEREQALTLWGAHVARITARAMSDRNGIRRVA